MNFVEYNNISHRNLKQTQLTLHINNLPYIHFIFTFKKYYHGNIALVLNPMQYKYSIKFLSLSHKKKNNFPSWQGHNNITTHKMKRS